MENRPTSSDSLLDPCQCAGKISRKLVESRTTAIDVHLYFGRVARAIASTQSVLRLLFSLIGLVIPTNREAQRGAHMSTSS